MTVSSEPKKARIGVAADAAASTGSGLHGAGEIPPPAKSTAADRLRLLASQTDAAASGVVTTARKVTDGGRPAHAPLIASIDASVDAPARPARETGHMPTLTETRGGAARIAGKGSGIARLLHALIAIVAVFLVVQGHLLKAATFADPLAFTAAAAWHRSAGMAMLVLIVLALSVRIAGAARDPPGDLAPRTRGRTLFINFALLSVLFLLPISGWLEYSAAGAPPARVLGLFVMRPLPALAILPLAERQPIGELLATLHAVLAIVLELAIFLHIALVLARWRRTRGEAHAKATQARL